MKSFEEIKKVMNKRGWVYDPLQMEFRRRIGSKVIVLGYTILEMEDEHNNLTKYLNRVENHGEELLV